ncbi:hypothetical protein [Pseudomonas alabamensis]|uniref:hypothetical protein n=1 Tax=Pseudomonas alabamensis TaxID=3064349 RepID=UPI000B338DB9
MTIFCISPNTPNSTNRFEAAFANAGVASAQSSHKSADISIQQWQTRVLAQHPLSWRENFSKENIDKKSIKLAIEVLSANPEDHWFWASEDSLQFIDFWKAMDEKIKFLLVYTDIKVYLANLLEHGELDSNHLSEIIGIWVERTEKIRLFQKGDPERCVLVWNEETDAQARSVVKLLTEKKKSSSGKATSKTSKASPVQNEVHAYIVAQILNDYPDAVQLSNTMSALLTKHIPDTQLSPVKNIAKIVDYIRSSKYQATDEALNKRKKSNRTFSADNTVRFDALETEKLSLQESFSQLAEEHERLKTNAENQLEQVRSENESIMYQLHNCQEQLEKAYINSRAAQKHNVNLAKALAALSKKLPDFYHFESIHVLPIAGNDHLHTQWHIENCIINGKFIPQIRFHTGVFQGNFGIIFHHPFTDWLTTPKDATQDNMLRCIPEKNTVYDGNNLPLTSLSTSSWRSLKALLGSLVQEWNNSNDLNMGSNIENKILKPYFSNLYQTLDAWPNVLRYDDIDVLAEIETETLNRLELRLRNASIINDQWEEVHYALSSIDNPGSFGTHPKLEFPKSSPSALDKWYPETIDERGSRLELRFKQPNVMDTEVWNVLSGKDQILIASLLTSLKAQLTELVRGEKIDRDGFQKWHDLSTKIKNIMSKNLNPLAT